MPIPWWAMVALAVVALGAALALLPVEFRVRLAFSDSGRGEEASFDLTVFGRLTVWRARASLAGLVRSRLKRAVMARLERPQVSRTQGVAERVSQAAGTARQALPAGRDLADTLLDLARQTRWRRLDWTTTVGTSDAASTALGAGLLWALKGGLAAAARAKLRLGPGLPRYEVRPDFGTRGVASRLDGIGVLRGGHITIALLRAAFASRHLLADRLTTPHGRRSDWPSTPFKA